MDTIINKKSGYKSAKMHDIDEVRKLLQSTERVAIIPHRKPDGDALGGSLALYHYFKQKGMEATVVAPSDYAYFLKWLPGNADVIIYTKDEQRATKVLNEAEVLFCLDFNQLERVEQMEPTLREAPGVKVLMDHHTQPDNVFDYNLDEVKASATAEIVYDFIDEMGDRDCINQAMAECIYTGILTDTGAFRFDRTSSKVHLIIADLIDKGAVPHKIHENVFDSFSETRLRFYGHCLKEKLTVLDDYHTAYISVTAEEMEEYNINTGDTEGLVNYALALEGFRFAAFMKEQHSDEGNNKRVVKISFRSKGDFLANEFARKHFNGGGHKHAAGGIAYEELNQTIRKFEHALQNYKHLLKK